MAERDSNSLKKWKERDNHQQKNQCIFQMTCETLPPLQKPYGQEEPIRAARTISLLSMEEFRIIGWCTMP